MGARSRSGPGIAAAGLCVCLVLACAGERRGEPRTDTRQPPEGLEFVPPEPGTYRLPPIQEAADGAVIEAGGRRRRLFDYLGDRLVLLSFIYTRCTDSEGCPLATGVLGMVRDALDGRPDVAGAVRMVSISFDPARDTPDVMRRYAAHAGRDEPEAPAGGRSWVFLTTASRADLQPILDGYGQSIVAEVDAAGRPTGDYAHVLKVYLIDRRRRVRNIYSTSFLHPATVLNDLGTLLMEEAP